jgi:branched-chain amino acid transport system permease protein
VLVMMYMPLGLMGLVGTVGQLRRRLRVARLVPLLALLIGAALLWSAGGAFLIEMLQRVFSQDYRSMARLNPGAALPAVSLLGRDWLPGAPATWLAPASLLLVGAVFAWLGRQRLMLLEQHAEEQATPGTFARDSKGGIA